MIDILRYVTPAQIILTCIALGIVGAFAIAHAMRSRPAPRNVRRVPLEPGNAVPRRPNVRRPMAATSTGTWPVDAPEWDEPTLTSPRGES